MAFNPKSLKVVTEPTVELITLEEAKTYLKIDEASEDACLTNLISAIRIKAEEFTHRAFITQTLRLTMDYLPCDAFYLWRPPVQSITAVKTFDENNVESTFASSNYFLHDDKLILNDNAEWPTEIRSKAGVQITYVAGYGDTPADVPAAIKQAMFEYLSYSYECKCASEIPTRALELLGPFISVNHYLEC